MHWTGIGLSTSLWVEQRPWLTGSVRLTQNLDIVYERSPRNLDRLVSALGNLKPYLRGAPPGLPFVWDRATLSRKIELSLWKRRWASLTCWVRFGGRTRIQRRFAVLRGKCLSLDQLIRAKRAAERPETLWRGLLLKGIHVAAESRRAISWRAPPNSLPFAKVLTESLLLSAPVSAPVRQRLSLELQERLRRTSPRPASSGTEENKRCGLGRAGYRNDVPGLS